MNTWKVTINILELHLTQQQLKRTKPFMNSTCKQSQDLTSVSGTWNVKELREILERTRHYLLSCSITKWLGTLFSMFALSVVFIWYLAGPLLNSSLYTAWPEYSSLKVLTISNTMVSKGRKMKMESMSLLLECTHGILNQVQFNSDYKDILIIMHKATGHIKSSED